MDSINLNTQVLSIFAQHFMRIGLTGDWRAGLNTLTHSDNALYCSNNKGKVVPLCDSVTLGY